MEQAPPCACTGPVPGSRAPDLPDLPAAADAGTNKQQQRGVQALSATRQQVSVAFCQLVLRPTGDGSSEHIGKELPAPAAIPLKEGVYEVGRSSPADIQIPVPTVSSRHALLRVGARVALLLVAHKRRRTTGRGPAPGCGAPSALPPPRALRI